MDRDIHGECNMWSVIQQWEKSKDYMLNKTMDQLTMAHSVSWYDHMFNRGRSCAKKVNRLRLKAKGRKKG